MATTERTTAGATPGRSAAATKDGGVVDTARDVAGNAIGVVSDAAARLPEATATTRGALADAGRTIQSGSDESLSAGTLVSFGFALGLLVGGANRILVMLALVPAAAMGLTLLDRQTKSGTTTLGSSRPGPTR